MKRVVLASKSPRRQELLKQVVDEFSIDVSNKPEIIGKFTPLKQVPVKLAKQKALEVFSRNNDAIVIGADTVVIASHQILGKPKDKEDVRRMITMLQNNTHIVVTGVCIKSSSLMKCFNCITKVTFRKMSEDEINAYCELDTIYDKAGAYAIQAEAGQFITSIDGDYNNVVGLPVEKIKQYINKNNF